MFARRQQWLSWILLLTLVLGGFACLLHCEGDECGEDADACAAFCVCQAANVLSGSVDVSPLMVAHPLAMQTSRLALPVFCADIFQPPRA